MLRLPADDPLVQSLFSSKELQGLRRIQRRKRGKRAGQLTDAQTIELELERRGLEGFSREYMFHGERRWRFDFAWVAIKFAVEFEGLVIQRVNGQAILRGRHATKLGIREDMVKYNAAAMLGWTVMRYEQDLVKSGAIYEDIEQFLRHKGVHRADSRSEHHATHQRVGPTDSDL